MRCIISTVGQSIFTNLSKIDPEIDKLFKLFKEEKVARLTDILDKKQNFPGQNLYQKCWENLNDTIGDTQQMKEKSAEIHSIISILDSQEFRENHLYYFLATATPDGVLAARIQQDFWAGYAKPAQRPVVKIIDGLQVHDASKFRLTGLPELVKTVYDILDTIPDKQTYKAIINPTGGFKAVVPYLTLIGMLEQIEMSYIYERSEELVTLASLPITLNYAEIEGIYDLLVSCNEAQQSGLSELSIKKGLGLDSNQSITDSSLWALFEPYEKGHYILSGLGTIALKRLEKEKKKKPVYLSKQAASRLDDENQGSRTRKYWLELLRNINDPVWLGSHRHEYKYANPTKSAAIKFPHQKERAFFQEDEKHILILELALELPNGNYDRIPPNLNDYAPFRLWEDR